MAEIPRTILIAGAGFGGITAALKLERRLRNNPDWRILLIDQNPYQLYTPALYEIAAIPKETFDPTDLKSIIAIPITDIIAGKKITHIRGKLTGIDRNARSVRINGDRAISYSFLILALGSETDYFDIPGLREHALPLKRFEDAVRIRNRIERGLAERRELALVVGGAGASGIELISEMSNFIRCLAERVLSGSAGSSRHNQTRPVRLVLIEASDTILPGVDPRIMRRTTQRLAKLGVEVRTGTRITSVGPKQIVLDGTREIAYDMLVWTGGVTGNPLCDTGDLPLTKKKNCTVNEFLRIDDHIFAIGDAAGFTDSRTGRLLPWNVPVAEAEARIVVKNILREIAGKPQIPFRPARRYPSVLAIGRKYAIADLIFIRLWGFAGWCAKLLVELRYLLFILPFSKAIRIWLKSIRIYTSND